MFKLNVCSDCGHDISKTAKSCPNCGKKTPNNSVGLFTVLFFF